MRASRSPVRAEPRRSVATSNKATSMVWRRDGVTSSTRALRHRSCRVLVEDARGTRIPRHDEHRPCGTFQHTLCYRALSEPPPPAPAVRAENDDIDLAPVGVEDDRARGIPVLLVDADLHARSLRPLSQRCEVLQPFTCTPRERPALRRHVKEVQPRLADHRETERAPERAFAGLLEIDRTQDPRKRRHAVSSHSPLTIIPDMERNHVVPNRRDTPQLSYGIAPPAFRLPDATHVGGVRLQVSDLRRSMDYYEEVLGLRVHTSTTNSAALAPLGDDRPLIVLQTEPGVTAARRGAFGLYHFAILLPERAALGRFAAHLSALGVRVAMADHLVSEALYLWDPDGLGIEVYADRPRSTWRHADRELAMTTDPLDIESVIAAGAGSTWNGAPPGTTMGHVHLHVGALDRAEAFYHRALGFDKTVWSYPGALFLS